MNKIITFLLSLMLITLSISNSATAQVINKTQMATDQFKFSADSLSHSNNVSEFMHLWWFGDNGFSFDSIPEHTFLRTGNFTVQSIVTENYGGGGTPPPPPLELLLPNVNASDGNPNNLDANEFIFVQNYRNAVPGDLMYLIVSYKNPYPSASNSGAIRVFMDNALSVEQQEYTRYPSYLPNNEVYSGSNTWDFDNLGYGEERTILVPVRVGQTRLEKFDFQVEIKMDSVEVPQSQQANSGTQEGLENGYSGSTTSVPTWGHSSHAMNVVVARSHDPNMIVERSNAENDCAYGGKLIHYDIHFENIGDGPTDRVFVVVHLDEDVDMNTISDIKMPWQYKMSNTKVDSTTVMYGTSQNTHDIHYQIFPEDHEIRFEFYGLPLQSPKKLNKNRMYLAKSSVSFDILVDDGYVFGPPIVAKATIVFDSNPEIVTNEAKTTCQNPEIVDENQNNDDTIKPVSNSFECCWIWILLCGLLLILLILALLRRRKK